MKLREDRLVPVRHEDSGRYSIMWEFWLNDFGWEEGLVVGSEAPAELRAWRKGLAANKLDWTDVETLLAHEVLANLGTPRAEDGCFVFASRQEAKAAIAVIKEAFKKQKMNKPWPAWAIKAQQEGWTPPDGWEPQ